MTPFLTDTQLTLVKQWLGTGSINIFGLPFAGKDTHGRELAGLLGAPDIISGGQILRNTDMSPELKQSLDAGDLYPTDDYIRIVTPYLSSDEFAHKPLVLSSVGRWIGEEQGILQAASASDHPIKAVLYLTISEETLHERWAKSQELGDRGERADDAQHVLENRINEFNQKTLPVIEEYRKLGLLIEINSDADQQEVYDNILSRLLQRAM